jgi:hypothetical protein
MYYQYLHSYIKSEYTYLLLHYFILLQIVGWGKTEKNIISPVLLEATLPYIDYNSCRSMYTNDFKKFVTFDKFCAGSTSGKIFNYLYFKLIFQFFFNKYNMQLYVYFFIK